MFARRAKGLLQFARCFQAGAPASGEAAGSVAAASQLEQWMQRSSFSTSMWDVGCDQARQVGMRWLSRSQASCARAPCGFLLAASAQAASLLQLSCHSSSPARVHASLKAVLCTPVNAFFVLLQELYMELNTARNLLPNRSNFFPEFTPHGVRLMPHRLPRHAMAAAAEEAEEDATEQGETEVLADSVRRKRKLKMKKHKYKKRMKKMRHQL